MCAEKGSARPSLASTSCNAVLLRVCRLIRGHVAELDVEEAMPALTRLDLSNNALVDPVLGPVGFYGTLPAVWGQTRRLLQSLNLSSNLIYGSIPAGWEAVPLQCAVPFCMQAKPAAHLLATCGNASFHHTSTGSHLTSAFAQLCYNITSRISLACVWNQLQAIMLIVNQVDLKASKLKECLLCLDAVCRVEQPWISTFLADTGIDESQPYRTHP